MANAKKCDICGKLYDRYNYEPGSNEPNTIVFKSEDSRGEYWSVGLNFDCCPECLQVFRGTLYNLRKRAEEVADEHN